MPSFFNPFTALGIGIVVGFAGVRAIEMASAHLEMSAVTQCSRRDWPIHKDQAMSAWCKEFNETRAKYGRY